MNIYEYQSKDTGNKSVFTKFEEYSYAKKPSVAYSTFHTFVCKLAGKNYRQMYGKLKMRLNVFWQSYMPHIWSIQYFA